MTQPYDGLGNEVEVMRAALADMPIGRIDWAQTIAASPRAIGILGECLLLTSHRRAASIELSGTGLPSTHLPGSLRQLAVTGEGAIHDSSGTMQSLSLQATSVIREGSGLNHQIRPQGADAGCHARLEASVASLEKVVKKCIESAEALQTTFQKWHEETLGVLTALGNRHAQSEKAVTEAFKDLTVTESAFEQIKVQLGFQDMSLQEIEQKVLERTVTSEATDVAASGIAEAGLLLCLMGASAFGGGIVLGTAIAIFGRKIFKANAERQREEEIRQLRANMLERQRLESKLNTLATQSATEEEIRALLYDAVEQLSELQSEVMALLKFFQGVFMQVKHMEDDAAGSARYLERVRDGGFREDDGVKQAMLEDAFALRVSFAFVGRIANMYSQVSQRCLLPQMREVKRIGLPGSSQTNAQMEGKKEMLRRICNESEDEVRRLTSEKANELNRDMEQLIRRGLITLRRVTSQ